MSLSDAPVPSLSAPAGQRARLKPLHRQARFATSRVVTALILREMTSTYGRSPGGYAWAILEPVAAIVLLSWVFSLALRQPQLGTDFTMFYATGWLPFHLFHAVGGKTAQALGYSRQLLAYPRVTIVDAVAARFLLNLMVQLVVACLVLAGARMLRETGTMLDLPRIVLGFAMAAALAAGVGTLNCFLMSAFPLWKSVWSIATRPLVIASGVLFLVDSVPEPYQSVLWWNPLVHVIAAVRSGFYYGYRPPEVSAPYVFAVSLAAGLVGLLFLWRYHRLIREM